MLSDQSSLGDLYSRALEIEGQKEADEHFEALVERNMRLSGRSREEAEEWERSNIGYWAGYYDQETRQRARRLYKASHPIFGDRAPSPEEAFQAGQEFAQRALQKDE